MVTVLLRVHPGNKRLDMVERALPPPQASLLLLLGGKGYCSSLRSRYSFPFYSLLFIQLVFLNFKENKVVSHWIQMLPQVHVPTRSLFLSLGLITGNF